MPKLTVRAVLVLLPALVALCLSLWCNHLRTQNKALHGAVDALAADLVAEQNLRAAERQVSARQATRLASMTTKQEKARASLQAALRGSPDWSAEPVPDSIADSLGLRDSATPAPAGSTSD